MNKSRKLTPIYIAAAIITLTGVRMVGKSVEGTEHIIAKSVEGTERYIGRNVNNKEFFIVKSVEGTELVKV